MRVVRLERCVVSNDRGDAKVRFLSDNQLSIEVGTKRAAVKRD